MANTYLSRTTGTPTQQNTWTWSAWVKFSDDNPAGSRDSTLLSEYYNSGTYTTYERINLSRLRYETGISSHGSFITNRSFADTNAFYHIVIVNDWSNSTTADRIKLYVNGVRETSFASFTAPSSGSSRINGASEALRIGAKNGTLFFNGIMSHIHFIDGTAYDASAFGETDATTGEWKIKTSPSVTYGNNGFFILKDSNSVTDQSGKGNNLTVGGGTFTKTEDNPSNVFATLNPLIKFNSSYSAALSNGSTTLSTSTGDTNSNPTPTTLGITTGKYYWETKFVSLASGTAYALTGIMAQNPAGQGNYLGGYNDSYGYASWNGTVYNNGGETGNTSGLATYGVGDILSMAFDADNNRLYYYKNGAIQNSGTGIVIPAASTTVLGAWFPAVGDWGSTTHVWSCNFGNGYFGTTAIASEGSNASGIGKFEYNVPSGYTALSTKGLNI